MGVRVIFLLDSPLVLFLLKHRSIWAFLKKKKKKKEDPQEKTLKQ